MWIWLLIGLTSGLGLLAIANDNKKEIVKDKYYILECIVLLIAFSVFGPWSTFLMCCEISAQLVELRKKK